MSAHWRQQALPEVACLHVWLRSTLVSLLGAAGAAGKQRGALLRTWRQRDNKERAALVAVATVVVLPVMISPRGTT